VIASSQVYKVEGPKHISVPIDTNDADDLLRLDSLRAGFPGYSDIEQVSDRLLRASVNRLATFHTWQLSERSNSPSIAACYIRYSPIDGAS
jgi:hypothetical protein